MFAFNNVQDGSTTCDSDRVLRLCIALFCVQSKYYFLNHIFSNAFVRFVIFFSGSTFHIRMWQLEIRMFVLFVTSFCYFVAFHCFSMSVISCMPFPASV